MYPVHILCRNRVHFSSYWNIWIVDNLSIALHFVAIQILSRWKVDDKDDPNQWDKPCDGLKERGDHLQNPASTSPHTWSQVSED